MKKLQAELLLNKGSRRTSQSEQAILSAIADHHIEITHITYLKPGSSLTKLISGIKARKPSLVIVGGGDGTISDVVDHFVGSSIELGIIPLGTTNNFARSLGIPLTIDGAVQAITTTSARAVDLGTIGNEYFANVAGVGLSALIADTVDDKTKKRFGRLAYAMTGLQQLWGHKAFGVTIEDKDKELRLYFETHQVIIANGRYHAGKQIAEDARLDNGRLIIFALGSRSKISFAYHTLDYYLGRRKQVAHESFVIGNNITISTTHPQLVELDGEVKGSTPLAISVTTAAVMVRH